MQKYFYKWAVAVFVMNDRTLYGLLFMLFFAKAFFSLDPDFGWHFSSGQHILQHGIPERDIYSYAAADFQWIHHEWLADTIGAWIYTNAGGYGALALLYAGLWTAALKLVAGKTKLRLIVLFAGIIALPFSGVRAITWTIILSALLYRLLHTKKSWGVYAVPLLLLFWANVHGSFVVGLAYIAWQTVAKKRRRLALAGCIALCLTIGTPYGAGMYMEIWRTMSDPSLHSRVAEWQPLQVGLGLGVFVGIWVGLGWTSGRHAWRRYVRFESLLLLMSLMAFRQAPLFVLFALPTVLVRAKEISLPKKKTAIYKKFVTGIVAGMLVLCSMLTYSVFDGYGVDREAPYPKIIASNLVRTPCDGNVFAHYDFGGYLIWKVPDQKLFIDGRMPSWLDAQGESYMGRFIAATQDEKAQMKEFARYNVRCVVWGEEAPFAERLKQQGWKVVLSEPTNSIVLLKR